MNSAHLHLVVNHLPFAFALVALIVLAVGMVGRNAAIKRLSLALVVLSSLAAGAAFYSGGQAEEDRFGESSPYHDWVERHEETAKTAWIFGIVTGVVGLTSLVIGRRLHDVPTPLMLFVLALLLVSMFLYVKTGNRGGKIMHPETRSDGVTKFLNPD